MLSTSTAGRRGKVPAGPFAGAVGATDWAISTSSWLVCDGRRVAPLTIAAFDWDRSVGLLGRDHFDEALLLQPAWLVHTFGMRFPIDVAFCDRQLRVISVITVARFRLTRPRVRARAVVEAAAGAFEGWRLAVGSHLSVARDPAIPRS
jgi:uncharacterized membrane protein (UPF0127 family)